MLKNCPHKHLSSIRQPQLWWWYPSDTHRVAVWWGSTRAVCNPILETTTIVVFAMDAWKRLIFGLRIRPKSAYSRAVSTAAYENIGGRERMANFRTLVWISNFLRICHSSIYSICWSYEQWRSLEGIFGFPCRDFSSNLFETCWRICWMVPRRSGTTTWSIPRRFDSTVPRITEKYGGICSKHVMDNL